MKRRKNAPAWLGAGEQIHLRLVAPLETGMQELICTFLEEHPAGIWIHYDCMGSPREALLRGAIRAETALADMVNVYFFPFQRIEWICATHRDADLAADEREADAESPLPGFPKRTTPGPQAV